MQILKNAQTAKPGNGEGQPDDQLESFSNESIKIDTELVQLDVTVIDQFNNPIFGLNKDDFTIYEDKVKQNIESVSAEEIPISFGVIVDTSGSMRERLQTVSDAALSLIKQKRQDDEAFVAQFKTEYEQVQDFTNDESDLEWAVSQFFTTGGTSLLDAIITSSNYAQKEGKRRRKAIVVISDGLEQNSAVKEKEVLEAIKENEVQLYMIGFIKSEELSTAFGKTPAMKAKDLLLHLAEDSGGRAFFPKDLSEIPAIAAQIAKDLRTQYIVSYYPTNEKKDSTFRSLRVDIKPKAGQRLVARARQGYFANGETEARQSSVVK
ncbi:MAG TPA: VWA domain-containing protein [Blastocatellia bacterium]|nr:VWA domain-containing protein [Blastocatellia bacterium]